MHGGLSRAALIVQLCMRRGVESIDRASPDRSAMPTRCVCAQAGRGPGRACVACRSGDALTLMHTVPRYVRLHMR